MSHKVSGRLKSRYLRRGDPAVESFEKGQIGCHSAPPDGTIPAWRESISRIRAWLEFEEFIHLGNDIVLTGLDMAEIDAPPLEDRAESEGDANIEDAALTTPSSAPNGVAAILSSQRITARNFSPNKDLDIHTC